MRTLFILTLALMSGCSARVCGDRDASCHYADCIESVKGPISQTVSDACRDLARETVSDYMRPDYGVKK